MSCFRLCDGDDCNATENDKLFHLRVDVKIFLKDNYPYWKHYNSADDLCDNCIDVINEIYGENYPLLLKEDCNYSPDANINPIYIKNTELLKEKEI